MKIIKYILLVVIIFVVIPTVASIVIYNYRLNQYIDEAYAYSEKKAEVQPLEKTRVHIVGTLHNESEVIKRNDLLKVIDSISPSVILMEADTTSCERILNRTDYHLQLINFFSGKNSMESSVVLKYKNKYPTVKVLPYEWEERDAFHFKHDVRSGHSDMINAIFKLYNEGKLSETQAKTVKEYVDLNKQLSSIERTGSLTDFNKTSTDSLLDIRQHYSYTEMKTIVEQRPELSEFLEFSKINEDY